MPCKNRSPRTLVLTALASALLAACGGGTPVEDESPLACLALPQEVSLFAGAAHNDWNDVLIDRRNRVFLAGFADGSLGDSTLDPSGNSRAVLRYLSPQGQVLAERVFDTPGTDVAEALAISAQGTLMVAGRTTGTFGNTPNAGQFDTFVAWNDAADAATGWRVHQLGNERPQRPQRIALAANGEIAIAGYDDLHVPSNHVASWEDPFTLRLARQDAGGANDRLQLRWQHQFSTVEPDQAFGLAVAAVDGSSYLTGNTASGSQRGMFVRRLGADGRALWTARYSPNPTDNIAAAVPLADGTLLIAGSVYGSFRGGTWQGQQDAFVARIAPDDGRVLASWQFGSEASEWVTDLKVDATGRIVVFGETEGSVVPGQPNAGGTDLFLAKFSANGEPIARRQWGSAGDDAARRVALDSCGRALAVGATTQNGRRAGVTWFWRG